MELLELASEAKARARARGKLDVSGLPSAAPELMFAMLGAARDLHAALEESLGELDLVVTDNRRRMLSAKRRQGRLEVRAHHMFVTRGARPDWLVGFVRGDARARERVRAFITDHRGVIDHARAQSELETAGTHHDLMAHLEAARGLLIGAPLEDVVIGWGRRGRGAKSIRLGSYDFEQKLVRVHPALDQAWVPGYFVEFVVYHELVHAVVGARVVGGRREVHTEEFRDLERLHPRYEDATEWERANVARVLRAK
jgi:hypothetical protein